RIAVTGSTGFLGTALIERLVRSVPDCELVLLVRPGRRGAQARVTRDVLKNDAFDGLRANMGKDAFAEMCERRVTAVAGDVGTDGLGLSGDDLDLWLSADVIIHSAATVSFDSPLDTAVEVNLLGPQRIANLCNEHDVAPHLVAVSTCYVAGSRRGSAPEQLVDESTFFVDVDWRKEVDAARRSRHDEETASRQPKRLQQFRSEARRELGAVGTPALAAKTESIRHAWVTTQMVENGRARASSLGFPDAYAYTKALGELALVEKRGDVPVSIVRPSIIESAWSEPVPGWIRGFRMAEPVIISYARGLLSEFPGVPEGVVDVIPVDMVVAAIVAVAARGPKNDGPDVTQVASGTANPLRYRNLVDYAEEWFVKNPIYDDLGQPIAVAAWQFPGRGRVERQLVRARTSLERADQILEKLPLRGRTAEYAMRLQARKELLDQASGYVELYGAYAECEALYGLENLLGLWDELSPQDRAAFGFDPRIIDWKHYVQNVHLPSVVRQARAKTTPSKKTGPTRSTRLRSQVLSPDRQMAVFDLENTIIASNVVTSFAWLATRNLSPTDRVIFAAKALSQGPGWLALDRKDRSDFLRSFYRNYRGASTAQIEADAQELLSHYLLSKSFPAAIRRVREHRALGHRTLLITGALDFVVEPLSPLFDDIISAEMASVRGRYTGGMTSFPPTAENRFQALVDYANANSIDLRESVAYADSSSDLPMLEAVGFPVAVNPETKLASVARKRGWLVENFQKQSGAPGRPLPIAPRTGARSEPVISALMNRSPGVAKEKTRR
ncbi:MAG: fatty acyl-CoA reductase, partial [Verrucomicrobiales bacterium]